MTTEQLEQAKRELAEKWCIKVIECMKGDDYIMHAPDEMLSDLTALISENYVSKEEVDKMVEEKLREELIKFFEYLDEYIPMVIHGGTAEIIINEYLKSRDSHEQHR